MLNSRGFNHTAAMPASSSIRSARRQKRPREAPTVPEILTSPPLAEPKTHLGHLRLAAHVAFLGWTVWTFIVNMHPLFQIFEPTSQLWRIARLTTWAEEIRVAFVLVEVLLGIKIMMAIVSPMGRFRRATIKAGAVAGFIAASVWVVMAGVTLFHDRYVTLPLSFLGWSIGNLGFGFALAIAYNFELLPMPPPRRICRHDSP